MDVAAGQQWFLRKCEDGSIFGPLSFDQLSRWASTARVAPADAISPDQLTWMKAPMLPELGMDWLVEVTSERYYGPTTVGAVHEFLRLGEITNDSDVINTCDGSRHKVIALESPLAINLPVPDPILDDAASEFLPAPSPMAINFAERIHDLEQSLQEERRALRESEDRYRLLETRYRELLEQTAIDGTLR